MLWRLHRLMLRRVHGHAGSMLLLRTGYTHLLTDRWMGRVLVTIVHLLLALHLRMHLMHWTLRLLRMLLLMLMMLHLTRMLHLLLLTVSLELTGSGIGWRRDRGSSNLLTIDDGMHRLVLVPALYSGHHLRLGHELRAGTTLLLLWLEVGMSGCGSKRLLVHRLVVHANVPPLNGLFCKSIRKRIGFLTMRSHRQTGGSRRASGMRVNR